MSLVLVESMPDPASGGIARELRSRLPHHEVEARLDEAPIHRFPDLQDALLVRTPRLHISDESIVDRLRAAGVQPTGLVFLSKHKSETGRPTLTAHPVGNFGAAQFGGQARRLTPAPAALLSEGLRCLAQARTEHGYDSEVSFEATHHGPLLDIPAMFIELGSTEREWEDPRGHQVLASAVENLLRRPPPEYPIVIGLGGGHYGPRFTEAVLSRRVHVSHIVPTYHAREATDAETLAEETVRASPGAKAVYYQDGTLPREARERWLAAFNGLGLPTVTSRAWQPLG